MARNYARILTSIWNDDDFLALESGPQRLYLMLLSQQNLSHAGLLPLTVKRWASKSFDTTTEQVEQWVADLEAECFIVTDPVTEELLIRSFIRGDEVYKQPNVMAAACTDALAIASPRLQAALAVEVRRIRAIEGLPARSAQHLETLSEALPNPFGNPSTSPPEKTPEATGMGKGMEVSRFPAPSPSPTPAPAPQPDAADAPTPDDPTSELLIEHVRAYSTPPPLRAQTDVKREIMRLVAEHTAPEHIRAGLARMRDKQLGPGLLSQLVAESIPTSGGRPSTTDARVAEGQRVAAELRAQGL